MLHPRESNALGGIIKCLLKFNEGKLAVSVEREVPKLPDSQPHLLIHFSVHFKQGGKDVSQVLLGLIGLDTADDGEAAKVDGCQSVSLLAI